MASASSGGGGGGGGGSSSGKRAPAPLHEPAAKRRAAYGEYLAEAASGDLGIALQVPSLVLEYLHPPHVFIVTTYEHSQRQSEPGRVRHKTHGVYSSALLARCAARKIAYELCRRFGAGYTNPLDTFMDALHDRLYTIDCDKRTEAARAAAREAGTSEDEAEQAALDAVEYGDGPDAHAYFLSGALDAFEESDESDYKESWAGEDSGGKIEVPYGGTERDGDRYGPPPLYIEVSRTTVQTRAGQVVEEVKGEEEEEEEED